MKDLLLKRLSNGHSLFAPSAAGRWTVCHGSIQLIYTLIQAQIKAGVIPEPASIYAAEGTLMHQSAGNILNDKKGFKVGSKLEHDGHHVEFTKEFSDAVNQYVDVVTMFKKKFPGKLHVEKRINFGAFGFPTIGGTADAIIDACPTLIICDYKGGAGIQVPAQDNSQLKLYSAMFLSHDLMMYDEVINVIVQPRHRDTEFYDMVSYKASELETYINTIVITAIESALSKKPSFMPSASACKWCEAKLAMICPEFIKFGFRTAQKDFKDFKNWKPVEINTLSPQELSEILNALPLMNDFISAITLYTLDQLQKGIDIPDYELKAGRSKRVWSKEEKEMVPILKEEFKLKPKDIYTKSFNGPAKITPLFPRNPDVQEKLNSYIIKPTGKPTVAKKSDKRDALDPTNAAKEDFAEELPDFFD